MLAGDSVHKTLVYQTRGHNMTLGGVKEDGTWGIIVLKESKGQKACMDP